MKNDSAAYSTTDIYTSDSRPTAASRPRTKAGTVRLKRGDLIRLDKNSCVKNIETRNGVVWLTATPADGDVLLQPGELFELGDNWPYVIQALEHAELLLSQK